MRSCDSIIYANTRSNHKNHRANPRSLVLFFSFSLFFSTSPASVLCKVTCLCDVLRIIVVEKGTPWILSIKLEKLENAASDYIAYIFVSPIPLRKSCATDTSAYQENNFFAFLDAFLSSVDRGRVRFSATLARSSAFSYHDSHCIIDQAQYVLLCNLKTEKRKKKDDFSHSQLASPLSDIIRLFL